MQNSAYKFIVFILTFFLVFNTASIAHAHTYETTNNVIKLDSKNSFFKNPIKDENVENLLKEDDYSVTYEMNTQILMGWIFTQLTQPLVTIILSLLAFAFSSINLVISTIFIWLIPLLFPFISSGFVYNNGIKKSEHSYIMTILGSLVGALVYFITFGILLLLDVYMITDLNTMVLQDFYIILILPLFSAIGGSFFYQMSEEKSTPNEPIKDSMSSGEIMNKIKNDFSFAEKIKVKNGAISLKIAGF